MSVPSVSNNKSLVFVLITDGELGAWPLGLQLSKNKKSSSQ